MPPEGPDLHSETLAGSWRGLRSAGEEARELAGELTRAQLWWRPEPDRWSVAECLDHLVRTGEAYLGALDESIGDARDRGLFADAPHRRTLVGRWLIRVLEPPPGLKIPAPGEIRPRRPDAVGHARRPASSGEGPEDDSLGRFLALRPRFGERLVAAEGLDLYRARVTSPFFRWIRFDLGSAFDVVAAHERRHLWQARQVRRASGFPEDGDPCSQVERK